MYIYWLGYLLFVERKNIFMSKQKGKFHSIEILTLLYHIIIQLKCMTNFNCLHTDFTVFVFIIFVIIYIKLLLNHPVIEKT